MQKGVGAMGNHWQLRSSLLALILIFSTLGLAGCDTVDRVLGNDCPQAEVDQYYKDASKQLTAFTARMNVNLNEARDRMTTRQKDVKDMRAAFAKLVAPGCAQRAHNTLLQGMDLQIQALQTMLDKKDTKKATEQLTQGRNDITKGRALLDEAQRTAR
jgi:hypothetical protein